MGKLVRPVPGQLHDAFAYVLEHYETARTTERIGKASEVWQRLMLIPGALAATDTLHRHPKITVRASAGQGSWARVPWVALLHADATDTTRRGVYLIFLFRADMTGVYLTLNQGVTDPLSRLGTDAGLSWVRRNAEEIRERVGELAEYGFELRAPVDLRSDQPAAKHYTASTIAHKLYETGRVPSDASMLEDVGLALTVYEEVLSQRRATA